MRMKKTISLFLSLVLILTMMSGIGPIQMVEAYESTDFYEKKEAVTDFAYSFAVVGDTQIVAEYDANKKTTYLAGIYDWILENQTSKNIEYVFGLGDITDNNNEAEWALAQEQMKKLDGVIPYSLVRGNHDLVGAGSAEDPTADYFTQYMGTDEYKEQFADGGFFSEDNTWNSWRTFTVGDIDYLMLALDWGASDAVLSWASAIIEEYSTYNVIITTHGYLFGDGTTVGTGEGGMSTADNNGEDMWNKLISKHENIVLVMSGHVPSEDIIVSQDEGEHGNVVTSLLIDPQDVDAAEVAAGNIPLGAVAMLYFSEDGKDVQVEYYATARDSYFKECNQFNFEIATVSKEVDDCERVVKEYSAEVAATYIAGDNSYPELDGYVFAGWYTGEECNEDCVLAGKTPSGTTYALFLPKHMLSVKAQVSANLIDSDTTNDEKASIRFITTIDSLLYKEAGFKLSYKNADGDILNVKTASKSVGRKLYVLDGSTKWGKTPEGTFCGVSKYFKACILKNISMADYYDTVFTLEPYFVTLDGDVVYGQPEEKSFKQGYESSNVKIDIQACENGTVATDAEAYRWGNTVTLNVTPGSEDYLCSSLKIGEWDVANDLVANGDGTYSYSFTAMDSSYTVAAEFTRKIFEDSTTWNVSKQFDGVVSTTNTKGSSKFLYFYDTYKDIDLTLHNVKHRAYNDTTGGRTDVLFDFPVDTDGDGVVDAQRNISFGIMWRKDNSDTNENGTIYVLTLGTSNATENLIGSARRKNLYTFTDADMISDYMGTVENGVVTEEGKGVDFRIIRSGTNVDLCVNGKYVSTFDLTMNGTVNITEDTEAKVQLRYYDAAGSIEIPFEVSDTADHIFNAKTGWDLTDKYNGVVSVDTTPVEGKIDSNEDVALPLAKNYGDIDITLKGVKEYKSLNDDTETKKVGRTDILFEFVDANKSTSVGIVYKNSKVYVETLGIDGNKITNPRQVTFTTLEGDEADDYLTGEGVDLRVIRSGIYLYVFINGRQVGMLDLTQNNNGVTAGMEAKVSLRHYDINSTTPLSFEFEVTDKVQEIELDTTLAEAGTITTNKINHIVYDAESAKSVVKENQETTTHFLGEIITLSAISNDGANSCVGLKVNGVDATDNDDGTYSFTATDTICKVVPEFSRRIFEDSTTWDVSKQSEGMVSTTNTKGSSKFLYFYDTYKDIDLTLHNVKHRAYNDTTGGRTDVLFEFYVDTDNDGEADTWKDVSFGIMWRNDDASENGDVYVLTLGTADHCMISGRRVNLYTFESEDMINDYMTGDGVDFRIIRSGTNVDLCVNGEYVNTFDLTMDGSVNITEDTEAKVRLRYYDAAGSVEIPFEVSDTADHIFTTEGATGTWDLTEKYNGTVSVNSMNTANVVLPTAKKYSDIDIMLKGVKENKALEEGNKQASRTDILFEFEDVNKSTSVGLIYKNGGVQVETLGINSNNITGTDAEGTRKLGFYTLNETEEDAYLTGDGVDFRVIRSDLYLYVYINDKQVGMLDLAQNSSGVTADMKVQASLRHYDINAEKIEFDYEVSNKVEEVKLDIASGNGTIDSGQITYITNKAGTERNCSKHFMGEKITLTVTPDRGYKCTNLQVNNKKIESDSYTFKADKKEYHVEAEYICRVFEDSTTWDVSKQSAGVVSTKNADDADKFLYFYDTYKDIDLTLHNIKHLDSSNTNVGGRTDVLFEFDVDTDNDGKADTEKNVSFGIMWRDDDKDGIEKVYVLTLGISGENNLISGRRKDLYTFESGDIFDDYMAKKEGCDGVDFRIIRSGTNVDLCVNGKYVSTFDLTMNGTVNITEDTEAKVQLRYYDGNGNVEIPFEVSDTADHVFTTEGATGKWDLTDKYNGVVSVDTTPVEGNLSANEDVKLPLANNYGDIDITLKGVKEYKSLNADTETTRVGRTDILFEFVDANKSTSVGIVYKNSKVYVETLGINDNKITNPRQMTFTTLEGDEADAYLTGKGVDLRVIRSGIYLYVFINGRQVGMLDLTQNNSGVTAGMEAKVSLRHYDINSTTPLSFEFEVSDEVQEIELDPTLAEAGTITTNKINHIVYDSESAKSVVKENQDITTHFLGETIALTVTPNEGYTCTKLQLNGKSVPLDENLTYTFVATTKNYSVVAIYEATTAETE